MDGSEDDSDVEMVKPPPPSSSSSSSKSRKTRRNVPYDYEATVVKHLLNGLTVFSISGIPFANENEVVFSQPYDGDSRSVQTQQFVQWANGYRKVVISVQRDNTESACFARHLQFPLKSRHKKEWDDLNKFVQSYLLKTPGEPDNWEERRNITITSYDKQNQIICTANPAKSDRSNIMILQLKLSRVGSQDGIISVHFNRFSVEITADPSVLFCELGEIVEVGVVYCSIYDESGSLKTNKGQNVFLHWSIERPITNSLFRGLVKVANGNGYNGLQKIESAMLHSGFFGKPDLFPLSTNPANPTKFLPDSNPGKIFVDPPINPFKSSVVGQEFRLYGSDFNVEDEPGLIKTKRTKDL